MSIASLRTVRTTQAKTFLKCSKMIVLQAIAVGVSAILLLIQLLTERDFALALQTLRAFISTLYGSASSQSSAKLRPPNPEVPQPASSSVQHSYTHAAICSDSSVCSSIGKASLLQGGSAVDAALATLLCNGLIAMQSMGLGGGLLLNIYDRRERRAYSILSREVAPLRMQAANLTKLRSVSQMLQSSLSIAVPTELMGYAVAHERFGKLPWAALVKPTLAICYKGYTLSKHQRDALHTNKRMVFTDALLRKMFVDPETGEFFRFGTHIKPPLELCRTYELLADNGPRSFYAGELADKLVLDLQDMGSAINEQDLHALKVHVVPSVALPLGEYLLHLTPPPGSGHILGFIMNILQNFEQDFRLSKQMGPLQQHRIVEALKFAFVKRWQLDTQLDAELLFNLTCPDFAREFASLILDVRTFNNAQHYGANLELLTHAEHGTAHISVLAANGDAVAATSSINFYFGSGRTGSRTGIVFNNAMADFSISGLPNYFDLPHMKHKNSISPGHSPMSSMAPVIVTSRRGDVRLVVGAAGGSKIISVLTQILVRTLWLGDHIKAAIDAARFHHQLLPNVLEYEYGILQSDIEALEAKGHKTRRYRERGSAVCGIEHAPKKNTVNANADYRKDGGVAGY